jgi:hypothetical protein
MPGFIVADVVTSLLRRVNFVGPHHLTGMQKPRRSAHAKACMRHGFRGSTSLPAGEKSITNPALVVVLFSARPPGDASFLNPWRLNDEASRLPGFERR